MKINVTKQVSIPLDGGVWWAVIEGDRVVVALFSHKADATWYAESATHTGLRTIAEIIPGSLTLD